MGKIYNFAIRIEVTGYIQRELEEGEDPEQVAQDIENEMPTTSDFTQNLPIEVEEVEVTDFAENTGEVYI